MKQERAGSVRSRACTSHGWECGGIAWPRAGRTGRASEGAWSVTGRRREPSSRLSRGAPRLAFEQSQWSHLLSSQVSKPFHRINPSTLPARSH